MLRAFKSEWILALLFFVPGWVFFRTEGDLGVYFIYQVPAGQFLYLLSKLCGLYALIFFGLQLLEGLLVTCGINVFGRAADKQSHRYLGIWVLLLLSLHGGLFVTAASLRNGHFAYKFLLPNFFESYYPAMVSLGLVAACLVIVGIIAAIAGKALGGNWIWLHRLSWPAFFLAWFHSYFIGSETRTAPLPYVFGGILIAVIVALAYRAWLGLIKIRSGALVKESGR